MLMIRHFSNLIYYSFGWMLLLVYWYWNALIYIYIIYYIMNVYKFTNEFKQTQQQTKMYKQ